MFWQWIKRWISVWLVVDKFFVLVQVIQNSVTNTPTPYGCIEINIKTVNRHILIICLFLLSRRDQLLHRVKNTVKKQNRGYNCNPTVKQRNTVKSSVMSISTRPGVVYIFGGRFSCQDRGRCSIPTQPIFLRILIQNLPSPYPIPTFHLCPTNYPISTISSSVQTQFETEFEKVPI